MFITDSNPGLQMRLAWGRNPTRAAMVGGKVACSRGPPCGKPAGLLSCVFLHDMFGPHDPDIQISGIT
jgi:hypothetical protein